MGSVRKELLLNARAQDVWDAVRDFGALHTRLLDSAMERGLTAMTRALQPDD